MLLFFALPPLPAVLPQGSPDLPEALKVCDLFVQHFSKRFAFIYFLFIFLFFHIFLFCSSAVGRGKVRQQQFFPITLDSATRGWNPLGVVQNGAGWDHTHGFDSSVFDCLPVRSTTPSPSASLQPGTTRERIMVYSHLQKIFCLRPSVLDPKNRQRSKYGLVFFLIFKIMFYFILIFVLVCAFIPPNQRPLLLASGLVQRRGHQLPGASLRRSSYPPGRCAHKSTNVSPFKPPFSLQLFPPRYSGISFFFFFHS